MILVDNDDFTLNKFYEVVFNNNKIELSEAVLQEVEKNYIFLKEFASNKTIYGINTGLGPMAQHKIPPHDYQKLQINLIRSHAAGIGNHLPAHFVKAAMLCRLVVLSKAKSGVAKECLLVLKEFINNQIIPVVSEHGGVGASGDLVQLSQIAICLIGEGQVYYKNELKKTSDVLAELNIKPLKISIREGLALINGTSFMTGVGLINLIHAKHGLKQSIIQGCLLNELVESFDDHYSFELNESKKHKTQRTVAKKMRKILASSKLISKREVEESKFNEEDIFKKKFQENYSLRCLPQVLGPIYKAVNDAKNTLLSELNSISDNPIIDASSRNIFHGGNFHGDFVSAELNKLKNAIIKLTVLTERQLNLLLNHKINHKFPPFLNQGVLGLNLGLQGAQYAATSTTSESQSLSASVYVLSIPSNNDNQDVVSMGTNEALKLDKVIQNFYDVNSVLLLAIVQAGRIKNTLNQHSETTKNVLIEYMNLVPNIVEDMEVRPILELINQTQKLNIISN